VLALTRSLRIFPEGFQMSLNRRDFLHKAASVPAAAALAGTLVESTSQVRAQSQAQTTTSSLVLPSPNLSGSEHVVVLMMENRSFDHLLGWLPNANGRQAGLTYLDSSGNAHSTARLNYYVGCSHPDPDHSYAGGRSEYDDGKMDGWLRTAFASATTRRRTCRYLGRWRATSPHWTTTFRPFSPRPFRTASFSTPRRPID
jgi:phospholipase C